MEDKKILTYVENVVKNMPEDWIKLTTHRLDIYEEKLAKTQFLEQFETLFENNTFDNSALKILPTAYDYIRLGHPLSTVLEWTIAKLNNLESDQVISFSSAITPILAVLRTNLLDNKKTQIVYTDHLPESFDAELIKSVYGYNFELNKINDLSELKSFEGSTILVSNESKVSAKFDLSANVDFHLSLYDELGSIIIVNGEKNEAYISAIQHVRRRETISMTPADSYKAIQLILGQETENVDQSALKENKKAVVKTLQKIAGSNSKALFASSGLSMQYAIMMGLVDDALENHKGKDIKFIVPPNCYGGTNDQARRVAACLDNVEVVDLPVDGENDMVSSTDKVLEEIAEMDAVPYIIAEIPTNPRVEVPVLEDLKAALKKERKTKNGDIAIDPVFILDQTFCPNVHFLGEGEILSEVRTISYASGSKFPSGGKCTAGYCIGNAKTDDLLDKIETHLTLCDNEATALQYSILAEQMPSMNARIKSAYENTRKFVNFIEEVLPEAKINFVSEELAKEDFTPSVFSLDLPTKGNTPEEKEAYKRELNLKLINMMITEIPDESKYCVSYGQLKGCYWTIPATSTQGTTKEGDKDYIARVSLSGNMDLERHKEVFKAFVESI